MGMSKVLSKKKLNFSEWRRQSKSSFRGNSLSCYYTFLRSYAIMFATQSGILTKQEVEAARRTIRKYTGRKTQICVFVKCCYPVTKKPKQSRMGSGKGKIANLVSHICCGKPLFGVKQKKGLRESGGLRYYRALVKGQTKLSLLTSVRSSLF